MSIRIEGVNVGRKKKFIQKPYTDNKVYKKSKVPFHINYTMRLSFVFISFFLGFESFFITVIGKPSLNRRF